jgi:hypothetical protein
MIGASAGTTFRPSSSLSALPALAGTKIARLRRLDVKSIRSQDDPERPAKYEIMVRGWVDESWSDWLDGIAVAHEIDSDDAPTTRLTATVVDQAALHSLLRRLHRLHLPLLSLNLVE